MERLRTIRIEVWTIAANKQTDHTNSCAAFFFGSVVLTMIYKNTNILICTGCWETHALGRGDHHNVRTVIKELFKKKKKKPHGSL